MNKCDQSLFIVLCSLQIRMSGNIYNALFALYPLKPPRVDSFAELEALIVKIVVSIGNIAYWDWPESAICGSVGKFRLVFEDSEVNARGCFSLRYRWIGGASVRWRNVLRTALWIWHSIGGSDGVVKTILRGIEKCVGVIGPMIESRGLSAEWRCVVRWSRRWRKGLFTGGP